MEKNRIVLDTSAYSEYLKGNQAIKIFIQQADEISLTPVILGELIAGFLNGRYEKKNRGLLKDFLMSPRVSMIEIDEETSERYAIIVNYLREQGTPIPTNDIWIAASAMQYGLKIITTDKHYLKVPLVLVEIPA
ncbi:MAG TPA: type II toxin-antitoxin system VapC family toxin [Nitrospirae bacterium]|nr:type II toxin-antitoxin system VapC family toxin [Nitrospirota bacterium]